MDNYGTLYHYNYRRINLNRILLEGTGRLVGGGRGIRTPDDREAITDFKSAGFNHSPIPPEGLLDMDVLELALKLFRAVCV